MTMTIFGEGGKGSDFPPSPPEEEQTKDLDLTLTASSSSPPPPSEQDEHSPVRPPKASTALSPAERMAEEMAAEQMKDLERTLTASSSSPPTPPENDEDSPARPPPKSSTAPSPAERMAEEMAAEVCEGIRRRASSLVASDPRPSVVFEGTGGDGGPHGAPGTCPGGARCRTASEDGGGGSAPPGGGGDEEGAALLHSEDPPDAPSGAAAVAPHRAASRATPPPAVSGPVEVKDDGADGKPGRLTTASPIVPPKSWPPPSSAASPESPIGAATAATNGDERNAAVESIPKGRPAAASVAATAASPRAPRPTDVPGRPDPDRARRRGRPSAASTTNPAPTPPPSPALRASSARLRKRALEAKVRSSRAAAAGKWGVDARGAARENKYPDQASLDSAPDDPERGGGGSGADGTNGSGTAAEKGSGRDDSEEGAASTASAALRTYISADGWTDVTCPSVASSVRCHVDRMSPVSVAEEKEEKEGEARKDDTGCRFSNPQSPRSTERGFFDTSDDEEDGGGSSSWKGSSVPGTSSYDAGTADDDGDTFSAESAVSSLHLSDTSFPAFDRSPDWKNSGKNRDQRRGDFEARTPRPPQTWRCAPNFCNGRKQRNASYRSETNIKNV